MTTIAGIESGSSATPDVAPPSPPDSISVPLPHEVESARSKLIGLRDAVMLPPSTLFESETMSGNNNKSRDGETAEDGRGGGSSRRHRWDGWETLPPYWVYSPYGCPIAQVSEKERGSWKS